MSLIKINQELCIKCGLCAEVCACGVVAMGEAGPEERYAAGCMECGHCVAICPKAAIDNNKTPLARQVELSEYPVLSPEKAAQFLRSRRSIRKYKQEKVSKEKMLELLDIARFAPTGTNSQGLSYIVVDKPEILKGITNVTIDWFEKQVSAGVEWAQSYAGLVKRYKRTGEDIILRDAPGVIVAIAHKSLPIGHDNARFSLEYVELYATTLGLGTCWAGFAELCGGANYQPLRNLLKVSDDMAIVGMMMVGYPRITYRRLVDRNPLQVTWL
ncbi:MAG: nitroreductase family protein [Pelosinus sp.]|nr:nitroreductase family protein [Pelosinus sp.]